MAKEHKLDTIGDRLIYLVEKLKERQKEGEGGKMNSGLFADSIGIDPKKREGKFLQQNCSILQLCSLSNLPIPPFSYYWEETHNQWHQEG